MHSRDRRRGAVAPELTDNGPYLLAIAPILRPIQLGLSSVEQNCLLRRE